LIEPKIIHIRTIIGKNESFNYSNKTKDVAIIIGADLFIRKNIFDKQGGFDPSFFMYIEDGELQFRLKKDNYRIVSVPSAKIIHLQGKSSNNINRLKMEIKSYLIFFRKHFNPLSLQVYKFIEVSSALLKFLICLILLKPHRSIEYLTVVKLIIKNDYDR
jgi:hypothetical protein